MGIPAEDRKTEVGAEGVDSLEGLARLLDQPLYLATTSLEGQDNAWILSYATRSSLDLLEPYMIVCVSQQNLSHEMVARSGVMALHLLRKDQWPMIFSFGRRSARDVDKLEGYTFERGETGVPILTDCVGCFEIEILQTLNPDGPGDHTCYLSRIVGWRLFDRDASAVLSMDDAYAHGYK